MLLIRLLARLVSRLSYGVVAGCMLLSGGTFTQAQVSAVRINEILSSNTRIVNGDGTLTDLVELHNTSGAAVSLAGCSLSDSNSVPRRYVFPAGSVVPANGFLTIKFDARYTNGPVSPTAVPFGIKASGGYLYFYDSLEVQVDAVEYGLQVQDLSIGRDGAENWVLTSPTFGSANVVVPMGDGASLKINEWLADQNSSGPDDYFEIFNGGNQPVALAGPFGGFYLSDTSLNPVQYQIAPLSFIGTGALAYVKFVADGSGTNRYPADRVNFKLSPNGTDSIILYRDDGFTELDNVYIAAGQVKNVSEGRLPDGKPGTSYVRFVKLNDIETRSPGEANFLLFTNIFINEILTHTDPPLEDAVEVQNRAGTNVNITGWWLSNSRNNRKRYQIPSGPVLTAGGGFRVIYEGVNSVSGFNSFATSDPFTFNSARGDQVVLSQVDGSGNLTGYIAYEDFESSANGVSFGHYRTSQTNLNDYKFVAMSTTTFGENDGAVTSVAQFRMGLGKTNTYPKVGPIVINEIMYAPADSGFVNTNGSNVFTQNPAAEYIELRNISPNPVPLYDPSFPTNHWKLQKAVSFVFPLTNLAANSFCLVVGFNPYTNIVALTNFRTRFSVSNDVPIFGPWEGRLSDSGDSIELYRPDPVQLPPHPDAGYVPYVRIDKVNYNSSTNWPTGTSGGGSLQRKNSLNFGNDPVNWVGNPPNAGRATPAELLDSDGDGMPNGWETANGFQINNPADAAQDADGDGFSNLAEYLAGSNPHSSSSFLRIAEIIPSTGTNVPSYVRFLAYANASYTVEYRNSLLPSSNWQKVGDVPSAPTNRFVSVPDPDASKKVDRYYRVVAPTTN